MAAGGQAVRLGPFIGGLNTASDPTAIADAELIICKNFELDIDGSLKSRPPYKELAGDASWTERIVMLCEGVFGSNHYLIASNADGVFHYLAGTWTLITNTFQAAAAVQYADFIYLVPKPGSGNGGKWSPGGGFTAVAAIPKGQACVIHKERLFVVPGIESTADTSRLKFSGAGNFDTWGGSDFIDVGQGDGSKLIEVTVFQDNLILFKNNSTYVLSYDTRPSEAVLRKISLTIGVNGQFCMVNYENQVYIFHGQWIYEIINYDFQRLNVKVPFERDDTAPSPFASESVFITLLEDRLVCRYYAKTYIHGLRTRTWSEWLSTDAALQYYGPIQTIRPITGNEYYSGSAILSFKTMIKFVNESTATTKEQTLIADILVTCAAKTKNFDMAISHQFKRLWWWGADVSTNNNIVGIATPITKSFRVTWAMLAGHSWASLNTWAQPLSEASSITTTAITGTGTARRFAKFMKGLRYRQINFEVRLTTEGSTVDGPARLFTMTAITESKQVVPATVN